MRTGSTVKILVDRYVKTCVLEVYGKPSNRQAE